MPSFLEDDSSPFSGNPDVLNLDPHNQFGAVKHKSPGDDIRHVQHQSLINEPFDESSATSTHESDDIYEGAPMANATTSHANGDVTQYSTHPSSIESPTLTNGFHKGPPAAPETRARADSTNVNKPLPIPSEMAGLPDRSLPQRPSSDVNGSAAVSKASGETTPRLAATSVYGSEDPRMSQASAPDMTPVSPGRDTQQNRSQTAHRFSSPPIYQPGQAAASASASNLLHPPAHQLKQRHTLEVPRPIPGRLSKDGMDSAQASGRYSPTVSGSGQRRASLSLARRNTRSTQQQPEVGPRDEIMPDEDAARWAETYRQKRASKRKKKEEEDEERVLVGTKVDESHANWVTAYNMLTGIRVSVSRTNAKLDRDLTDADFEAKQKSTFDIAGNELVPSAKYDFKFKDYAPWVFRRLRTLFRLDPADYLVSLTGKYILSELGSPGKSGSFFYFSRDYKYIIKTIHHAEHKFLRKVLKEYYLHVMENPNTLLSQFYGLHRVKMPYGKKIHFVVMNNLFPPHRDIHSTFDLKGSTVGRDYREEELSKNPRATLKDLNWLRRQRSLELGVQKKQLFLEQLQRDVVLLKKLKIMDYSLLIGIHDLSRGNEENLRDKTLQVFNPVVEKMPDDDAQTHLRRTPSKMESARKARELRQMIRQERPVPMGQALDKMPDELAVGHSRPGFVFNQDDGGFQATHEDNEPADEIYYLGVIDCLTHYGVIKKIEHFWKGLSSDKTQISALPPEQYGDRFFRFIEGNTMSPEAARQEAQRRDEEMQAQALQEQQTGEQAGSRKQRSSHAIPPMPDHLPPPPPGAARSPEGRELVERATEVARKTEAKGASEKHVPDRVLRSSPTPLDGRDPVQHDHILPVVQEDGEHGRSDVRPLTPNVDKALPPTRAPPPTPPKNVDGINGMNGFAGDRSHHASARLSRESARNKTLPPLPKDEEPAEVVRAGA